MRFLRGLFALMLTVLLSVEAVSADEPWKVSGRVVDTSGEPLAGVVVKMADKGGKTVAFCSTNGGGSFTLRFSGTPGADWTVTFAFLGFSPQTFTPAAMKDGMTVTLADAPLELKEVVVKVPPITPPARKVEVVDKNHPFPILLMMVPSLGSLSIGRLL